MRLGVHVVTELQEILQVRARYKLLGVSPRLDDAVRGLLVGSRLIEKPRSEHARIAGSLPRVNHNESLQAFEFRSRLHTLLVLSYAVRHEGIAEDLLPLLLGRNGTRGRGVTAEHTMRVDLREDHTRIGQHERVQVDTSFFVLAGEDEFTFNLH